MNTATRTILSAAAATGILCLTAPVSAADGPDARIRSDQVSSSNSPDWGLRGSKATSHRTADPDPQTVVRQVHVDDDSLEYVQIGVGALTGMALAGAATVGLRRLNLRAPRPA